MSKTPIPPDMKREVVDRDGIDCLRCGCATIRHVDGRVRPDTPAFDHVWPEAQGGPTIVRNLQLLCTGCNRAKGATHADYRTAPIVGGAWHLRELQPVKAAVHSVNLPVRGPRMERPHTGLGMAMSFVGWVLGLTVVVASHGNGVVYGNYLMFYPLTIGWFLYVIGAGDKRPFEPQKPTSDRAEVVAAHAAIDARVAAEVEQIKAEALARRS